MTNYKHPITPPSELVEDWIEMAKLTPKRPPNPNELATIAARWGADQELDAGRDFLERELWGWGEDRLEDLTEKLYAARRPKPPSLKEQALDTLKFLSTVMTADQHDLIQSALERLSDDER